MTMVRVGLARAVALLGIGLLAVGCTVVTGGKAQAPPRSGPRSVTGQTIRDVLLDNSMLGRILDQPFIIDRRLPPRYGGPEALENFGVASSADCLGVAEMLHHSVYQPGKVNDVAFETWRHADRTSKLTAIKEGVVSLPTAADANALFAKFAQQWPKCNGQALLLPDPVFRLRAKISDVKVAPAILAGTVAVVFDSSRSEAPAIPAGRAIGVRANCLVEVEVDFFNTSNQSLQGSGLSNATATNIAQVMMDRVSALI